ncbi:MAG: helix-turn-helix domain-containing protein [Ruminococcaceae bacterium]|nr:helix-turn-helix domain-containing protein [Oscillospiraceae bacterium]
MKRSNRIRVLLNQNISREDCSFYIRNHKIDKPFALHRHEFFEIDIVISGKAKSNINGHVYNIEKGSILFFTPADFHDIIPIGTQPLETYNIAFPTHMIYKQIWTFVPMSCRFATLSPANFQSAVLVCQRLMQAYKNPSPSTELLMKTGIEWCLFLLADAANALSDNVQFPKDISAVLAYIYDNFTGRVSRDEAAAIMHVSPIYFSNLFHKHMGLSFQEYLLNLRLDFARRLLIGKGTTVSDAAYSSGFNSVTYFSRVFTRRFGCPPGKYAEQNSL